MKGFPTELIYALLFGAALLLNFVMQRVAKRKQREVVQNEPLPEEIPEEVWGHAPLTPYVMPEPVAVGAPARRAAAPTVPPARRGRRFARRSLFANRRKVQDAFVVAAILGRCRADEPHDIR